MKSSILRKMACLLLALILTFTVVGCGSSGSGNVSSQLKYQPADVNADLVDSYNQFALKLYTQLIEDSDGKSNLFISPTSIAAALAMTLNGANADTLSAMQQTLELQDISIEEINHGNQVLINLLQFGDPGVQLKMANSIWSSQEKNFYPAFIETNESYYDATVQPLDFSAESAADTINQWVEDETEGYIDQMVEQPIDQASIMFLLNAIYFNGRWTYTFDESQTRKGAFHLADGSTREVDMMRQTHAFAYKMNEHFQAIRLPYGEKKQWNMIIVLPSESTTLQALYPDLLASTELWTTDYTVQTGDILLPRFHIQYETELNEALKALGMDIAYDQERADFSRMADVTPNIFISNVKHKAFIELDEKGTEAAAATSVEMSNGSDRVSSEFQMIVDRPFFFAIEDQSTGSLVFMGSYLNE